MQDRIEAYLRDHETAWAPSTLRSESARLRKLGPLLAAGPEKLYHSLREQGMKMYTVKTCFIRVCQLEKWSGTGELYQRFMRKHGNRFKHAYQREEIQMSYDDALRAISTSLSGNTRVMALGLLQTGLRLSEAYKIKDGMVEGKGGKVRKVYGRIEQVVPKGTFARELKAVGLKPHTLRKLCATRLAEKGATPADLCKVFGWSSITTSYNYLQAQEDSRIESLMEAPKEGA